MYLVVSINAHWIWQMLTWSQTSLKVKLCVSKKQAKKKKKWCVIFLYQGQLDYSQSSGPLITPPISPAMANRGSVINQGPMAVRSPGHCPVQPHAPCQAFPDGMYQSLPASNYCTSTSTYQPTNLTQTHTPPSAYPARNECSRYSSFSGQQLAKDCFNSSCSGVAYSSRTSSVSYPSTSEPTIEVQGVQLMDYGFAGSAGGCSGPVYTSASHSGEECNSVALLSVIRTK